MVSIYENMRYIYRKILFVVASNPGSEKIIIIYNLTFWQDHEKVFAWKSVLIVQQKAGNLCI